MKRNFIQLSFLKTIIESSLHQLKTELIQDPLKDALINPK